MKGKLIIPGLLAILLFGGFRHPFYMSVTELSYNQTAERFEGSTRIFTNDLEEALRKLNPHKKIDLLGNAGKGTTYDSLLCDYVFNRLKVLTGPKHMPLKLNFVGWEIQEEALWFYFESSHTPKPAMLSTSNTILCDYISQQLNIIQVKMDGKEVSSRTICPDSLLEFRF